MWYSQGFTFCESDKPGARLGFVQPANGPCGALSATYAEVVTYLLFSDAAPAPSAASGAGSGSGASAGAGGSAAAASTSPRMANVLNPTDDVRRDALAHAMATMLCRASEGRMAGMPPSAWKDSGIPPAARTVTVVLPSDAAAVAVPDAAVAAAASRSDASFTDPFMPGAAGAQPLLAHTRQTFADVKALLVRNLDAFIRGPGPLLLVYSMCLTRGVEQVREDCRDEPSVTSLIYENGCSEQCLLHLMLYGTARHNVNPESWPGWEGHCDIGFLTTEEVRVSLLLLLLLL